MTMTSAGAGPSRAQGLLAVHKGSTLLPPSPPLRRLLMSLDKSHLIQVALYWIEQALAAPSSDIVPPQLSRRPPRRQEARHGDIDDIPGQDDVKTTSYDNGAEDATTTASFLDLYEDRRARSYEELRILWSQIMPEARVARTRAVDRIVDVDWPQGISFSMAATVAFEVCRANQRGRNWTAMCFDFGASKQKAGQTEMEDPSRIRDNSPYLQRLKSMSPTTFADMFSAELRHYCSHAIFVERPIESKVPHDVKLDDEDAIAPLPEYWAAPFTHVRVVTCDNPTEVCSIGLHVLHIPQTPWCLVSGSLGRGGTELREMALNALANAVGARSMRMPKTGGGVSKEEKVSAKKLGELRGRDPISLRDVLVSAGLVDDHGEGASAVPGGKGRRMRKGEAEDGPLTRPEKRQREDKSGLYAEADGHAQDGDSNKDEHSIDPTERKKLRRRRAARLRARQREVEDLFGQVINVAGDADLPRIEKIQYDLYLPFSQGHAKRAQNLPEELVQEHPITLRLEGTHVLAGLRKLVHGGLDEGKSKQGKAPKGLPSWLVEVRGTRVRIGAPAKEDADDDIDLDSLDEDEGVVGEDEQQPAQSNGAGSHRAESL